MISMTKESAAFAISTHAPAGGATAGRCSCQPEASYFYSRPCGRGDLATVATVEEDGLFLLTPLREGRRDEAIRVDTLAIISTHAPAGGATIWRDAMYAVKQISTHAPAGGATKPRNISHPVRTDFYSRPCGRGDAPDLGAAAEADRHFYSRPCGRGDRRASEALDGNAHFYSRPCGRGDNDGLSDEDLGHEISTHAPAGGATQAPTAAASKLNTFLLTPLREGRRDFPPPSTTGNYFYSRPCGRGDSNFPQVRHEVLRQIAER